MRWRTTFRREAAPASQRTCHVHLITKRHVSLRWRHEKQLSSIGRRRQEWRSRGISRCPCLSQSRSGASAKIRLGDVEKLQFLSEVGESGGFLTSDKGVVLLDNHDTQRGEAQITHKNDDLHQLASLSLPTHVAEELVADLFNWRLQLSTIRLQLCLPASHPNTVDHCLEKAVEFVSEPSLSTMRRSGDSAASWNRLSTP